LHISREEFYNLTPIEFYEALKDHSDQTQVVERNRLESMRLQTLYLINIQLAKENKFKSLHEVMPFNWDSEGSIEVPMLTSEDWLQLDKRYLN